nr:hypothetical protein [Paracoccus sp. (in: a-proteobacteria)]
MASRATTIVVGTERVKTRGKWRTVEVLGLPGHLGDRIRKQIACRVTRAYEDWWGALDWLRDGLLSGGMLQDVEVTATMPKVQPWQLRCSSTPLKHA